MKTKITSGSEHCYLDAETRQELWELTQKQGISRNKFVADAVKEKIKREKKK